MSTVDEEMVLRNEELGRANGDLVNFLVSVHLALATLGPDLGGPPVHPQAEKLLNLTAANVGRPIRDIDLPIICPDQRRELVEVIDTACTVEEEVRERHGRWYSLRLRPYRTLDNRIDGAVLVFVDITA